MEHGASEELFSTEDGDFPWLMIDNIERFCWLIFEFEKWCKVDVLAHISAHSVCLLFDTLLNIQFGTNLFHQPMVILPSACQERSWETSRRKVHLETPGPIVDPCMVYTPGTYILLIFIKRRYIYHTWILYMSYDVDLPPHPRFLSSLDF